MNPALDRRRNCYQHRRSSTRMCTSMIDQYAEDGCDHHRAEHDVDRFNCVAVPHQNCSNVTTTIFRSRTFADSRSQCGPSPSRRRAARVWRLRSGRLDRIPLSPTRLFRSCCTTACARSVLRPRGLRSFGVISVASVTGAEEESRIGINAG